MRAPNRERYEGVRINITDITVIRFQTHADRYANGQTIPKAPILQMITTIETDEGICGRCLSG